MTGSEFVFDFFHLLYYNCHKVNPNRDQIKNKKATKNPISKKNNKCFQYAVAVALNDEEIKKDPQRIKKISLLQINKAGKE